jgi:hypothetical protein
MQEEGKTSEEYRKTFLQVKAQTDVTTKAAEIHPAEPGLQADSPSPQAGPLG